MTENTELVDLEQQESNTDADTFSEESVKHLIRSVISAAIWIPDVRVSKRDKATFVN